VDICYGIFSRNTYIGVSTTVDEIIIISVRHCFRLYGGFYTRNFVSNIVRRLKFGCLRFLRFIYDSLLLPSILFYDVRGIRAIFKYITSFYYYFNVSVFILDRLFYDTEFGIISTHHDNSGKLILNWTGYGLTSALLTRVFKFATITVDKHRARPRIFINKFSILSVVSADS